MQLFLFFPVQNMFRPQPAIIKCLNLPQYNSFGKLRHLMMAGWGRNVLWKGKNKNSCIVDGTILLCVKARWIINKDVDVFVASFKALTRTLPRRTEENHEKNKSRYSVSRLSFEPGTPIIQVIRFILSHLGWFHGEKWSTKWLCDTRALECVITQDVSCKIRDAGAGTLFSAYTSSERASIKDKVKRKVLPVLD
jgi:hypothetical protein